MFSLRRATSLPRGLRLLSSASGDISALNKQVSEILKAKDQDAVLAAVKVCKQHLKAIYDYNKFWENPANLQVNDKIVQILKEKTTKFDSELLRKLLLLRLPTKTNINIISAYYDKNPKAFIDKKVALVPFRYAVYNGDLKAALRLTDMTTGHPNYVAQKGKDFNHGLLRLVGTSAAVTVFSKYGVQELIEAGIVEDSWRVFSSINSLILTYLINSTFLMTVVRFGRQLVASGGDYLTWQKGTFYTHWFKHADEMLMCNKIVEADIKLNGGGASGGEVSDELVKELCRPNEDELAMRSGVNRQGQKIRLLDMKDNLEDLKMQAYWMSGGDGFEWVEPDQDPAELLWERNLRKFKKGRLGDAKWVDKLLEGDQESKVIDESVAKV